MHAWLIGLSPQETTFFGTLAGSSIGLIAILIGALFNAFLNRRRDSGLRIAEKRGLAAALRAELSGIADMLTKNADQLEKDSGDDFLMPDPAHYARMPQHLFSKIGLLPTQIIREVLDCYIVVDQFYEALLMMGGKLATEGMAHRRLVGMPAKRSLNVAKMCRNVAARVKSAEESLDRVLM